MAETNFTPTTGEVRATFATFSGLAEHEHDWEAAFDRWLAAHDAEVKAEALRGFAARQDSWCEAGRGGQVISREAMRDALLAEADSLAPSAGAPRASVSAEHPEHTCLLSNPHDAHDWVYTAWGGGHQMDAWDYTGREKGQKWWRCPGITVTDGVRDDC